jgi:hypothetical protein
MSSINATIQVPKLKMTRVHIPFTFRLLETGNNSFDGEFKHKSQPSLFLSPNAPMPR